MKEAKPISLLKTWGIIASTMLVTGALFASLAYWAAGPVRVEAKSRFMADSLLIVHTQHTDARLDRLCEIVELQAVIMAEPSSSPERMAALRTLRGMRRLTH